GGRTGGERDQVTRAGGGGVREHEAQDHGRGGEQHPVDERFHGEPGEYPRRLNAGAAARPEARGVAADAPRCDRRRRVAVRVDRHGLPEREASVARHEQPEPHRAYAHVGRAQRERGEMSAEGWEHASNDTSAWEESRVNSRLGWPSFPLSALRRG